MAAVSATVKFCAMKIYQYRNEKNPRYTIDDVHERYREDVIKYLKDEYDYEV